MHGDFGRLVLQLTYLFYNLVDLRIDFVEPVKREMPGNQENGGKTGRHRSGRRGLSKCTRGCQHKICQPMWGYCSGKNSDHHKTMENEQTRRTATRRACTSEGNAMGRTQGMFTLPEGFDQELVKKYALKKMALAFATFMKKLYINYIKKDKEPIWDDLPQVKPYWEKFKQYKLSEEAQEKSE